MTLDQLSEKVLERIKKHQKNALLIGKAPPLDFGFVYGSEKPYEAVVVGILQPGELLQMPTDPVCCALLEGVPVYFWMEQPYREAKYGKLLCKQLREAEHRMLLLGALSLSGSGKLITARDAQMFRRLGLQPDQTSRLTPLAKEILEENT